MPRLVRWFDWAIAAQCVEYDECDRLLPFVRAGKAVLAVEYTTPLARLCASARRLGISALRKRPALGPWRQT